MMEACARERSATDYTLQACAVVVGQGFFGWLSGPSAQALGYAPHFAAASALTLVGCVLAARTPPPRAAEA
jgi:hypothetical protein